MNVEQPSMQASSRATPSVAFSSRSRFATALRRSYDLLLLSGLSVVLPGLLLIPIPLIRLPLGLAVALLAPGYALMAALFARRDDVDGITRFALSFGLSVALLPLFALMLDKLPWGIRPISITLSVSLWLLLCCGVALWRRWTLLPSGVADIPPPFALGRRWHTIRNKLRSPYRRALVVIMGIFVVGTSTLLVAPTPGMTEFYILGNTGLAEDYLRAVVVGEPLQVTLGITNREPHTYSYRVEVWADNPFQPNQRMLVGQSDPAAVVMDQTHQFSIQWRMPQAHNDQQVEFLLFKNDDIQPYRSLQLVLNVVKAANE